MLKVLFNHWTLYFIGLVSMIAFYVKPEGAIDLTTAYLFLGFLICVFVSILKLIISFIVKKGRNILQYE